MSGSELDILDWLGHLGSIITVIFFTCYILKYYIKRNYQNSGYGLLLVFSIMMTIVSGLLALIHPSIRLNMFRAVSTLAIYYSTCLMIFNDSFYIGDKSKAMRLSCWIKCFFAINIVVLILSCCQYVPWLPHYLFDRAAYTQYLYSSRWPWILVYFILNVVMILPIYQIIYNKDSLLRYVKVFLPSIIVIDTLGGVYSILRIKNILNPYLCKTFGWFIVLLYYASIIMYLNECGFVCRHLKEVETNNSSFITIKTMLSGLKFERDFDYNIVYSCGKIAKEMSKKQISRLMKEIKLNNKAQEYFNKGLKGEPLEE